jgi:hypothetical protein
MSAAYWLMHEHLNPDGTHLPPVQSHDNYQHRQAQQQDCHSQQHGQSLRDKNSHGATIISST